jgi:translation initiation factor 1
MAIEIPCPQCGRFPPPPCGCPPLPPGPPDKPAQAPSKPMLYPEILKLRREKRNGREVIIIEGFNPGTQVDFDSLAAELKRTCGTGGTVKGRTIEIQGDHRDDIAKLLLGKGFRSKRAGG